MLIQEQPKEMTAECTVVHMRYFSGLLNRIGYLMEIQREKDLYRLQEESSKSVRIVSYFRREDIYRIYIKPALRLDDSLRSSYDLREIPRLLDCEETLLAGQNGSVVIPGHGVIGDVLVSDNKKDRHQSPAFGSDQRCFWQEAKCSSR